VTDSDRRSRYAWYVVGVLMLANFSSFVDRQVLALLVDPIKHDFGLTDTQVSWLGGLAFALFYSVLGFPIGRLADVRSRRAIIGWGAALWSVMCAACGLARSYGQLFAARVGVGVGEATLLPPAFSLIADYFPRQQLAIAMSVLNAGSFLGSGLAYTVGGTVIQVVAGMRPMTLPLFGELRSWQAVFFLVGIPGVLVALLLLTVREPARPPGARAGLPLRHTFAYMRAHFGAFAGQGLGYSVAFMVNLGTAFWFPAYFSRVHGWSSGRIGVFMGGATMIFGTLGILSGGWMADWLKRRGYSDANMRLGIIASAFAIVAAFPMFLATSFSVLITGLIATNIAAALPWGAAAAALQEITPASMRGQISAIYLFALNLIGAAGPTVVALITDRTFRGQEDMVGISLLVMTILGRVASGALLWLGLPGFRRASALETA
jgi:MFS family permease